MANKATFSLWLEPSGQIAFKLQERIKKLSKKHGTPLFSPHVTLFGGVESTGTEMVPLTDTLASYVKSFELELTKAGYLDTFYQSLFIHVKETDELKKLRKNACRLYGTEDDGYMPHLSLLYGDLPQKKKEEILNIVGREFYIRFPVNKLSLMQTDGKPDKWNKRHVAVFKEH